MAGVRWSVLHNWQDGQVGGMARSRGKARGGQTRREGKVKTRTLKSVHSAPVRHTGRKKRASLKAGRVRHPSEDFDDRAEERGCYLAPAPAGPGD
jgi:hypothetical protein